MSYVLKKTPTSENDGSFLVIEFLLKDCSSGSELDIMHLKVGCNENSL